MAAITVFTSPVRTECGMFVIDVCSVVCMCQLFLDCVDVLAQGGIYNCTAFV